MDFSIEIFKSIGGLISAGGAMAVTTYNLNQSKKVRSEILEKFEIAIKNENKHSACELFRLLHGLRMTYDDICHLIKDDHVVQIIFALKKTPGMVKFKDGKFQFTELFENKYIKNINKISNKTFLYAFGASLLISILAMGFSKGAWLALAFVMTIFFSVLFVIQKNEYNYDNMVDEIVAKQKDITSASTGQCK